MLKFWCLEKFRPAIYEYPSVISTAVKMLKAAKTLGMSVYATTQNAGKLGVTCSELAIQDHCKEVYDKTLFSMCLPGKFPSSSVVAIVGIESHVCVLQTTLDLLAAGKKVYIIADGVSSCNKEEVPIAIARMRQEGAKISTSESFIYEVMSDASIPEFKQIAALVKDTKQSTKVNLEKISHL